MSLLPDGWIINNILEELESSLTFDFNIYKGNGERQYIIAHNKALKSKCLVLNPFSIIY